MNESIFAVLCLAVVLTAWAGLAALRKTTDRRWAAVKKAAAAYSDAEWERGATGPPMWT